MSDWDLYTVILSTVNDGGTPVGLAACSLVWFMLGLLIGFALKRRQPECDEAEQCPSATNSNVVQSSTADQEEPKSLGAKGRKARAVALEQELKKQQPPANNAKRETEENKKSSEESDESSRTSASEYSSDDEFSPDQPDDDDGYTSEDLEDMRLKMVLIVRKDLPLSASDVAADAASSAVGVISTIYKAYHQVADEDRKPEQAMRWWKWYLWWSRIGVAKITLKCPDQETMEKLQRIALEKGLPLFVCSTGSVLAVGPAPSKELDPVSGDLKLLS